MFLSVHGPEISTALKRIAQYIYLQYLPLFAFLVEGSIFIHTTSVVIITIINICWEEAEEQVGSLLSSLPSSTSEEVVGSWFNTTDVDDGNDGNGRWVAGSIQAW